MKNKCGCNYFAYASIMLIMLAMLASPVFALTSSQKCKNYGYYDTCYSYDALVDRCFNGNPHGCYAEEYGWTGLPTLWCWEEKETCGSNEQCTVSGLGNGYCKSICYSNDHKSCYNGDVYWYNSCGTRGSLYDDCSSTEDCSGSSCVCKSHYEKKCYNGNSYWYDGCGSRQDVYDTCGSGETCSSGTCSCIQNYEKRCYDGDVYWYDGCGNKGSKATDCDSSTEKCASAQCVKKCKVTNCRWEPKGSINEGSNVQLKADFSYCDGKTVSAKVFETDWPQSDAAWQEADSFSWLVSGSGTNSKSWNVKWIDDTGTAIADINPEYTFRIWNDDGELQCDSNSDPAYVVKAIKICNNQCSSGQKLCEGNSWKECDSADKYGCYYWKSAVACGTYDVCENGNCRAKTCGELGYSKGSCSYLNGIVDQTTCLSDGNPYDCKASAWGWTTLPTLFCWQKLDTCGSDEQCNDPISPFTGARCELKPGCQYHNPDCDSSHDCVSNVCQLKQGCQYHNPDCDSSHNCISNACVLKPGCQYHNPDCDSSHDCVSNVCQLKQGCQYHNPDCQQNYECKSNTCAKIPCTATNCRWSTTGSVLNGDNVQLLADFKGECSQEKISAEIYEVDLFTRAYIKYLNRTGAGSMDWKTEWTYDGIFSGDPEYIFKLYVNGQQQCNNSGPAKLQVHKDVVCGDNNCDREYMSCPKDCFKVGEANSCEISTDCLFEGSECISSKCTFTTNFIDSNIGSDAWNRELANYLIAPRLGEFATSSYPRIYPIMGEIPGTDTAQSEYELLTQKYLYTEVAKMIESNPSLADKIVLIINPKSKGLEYSDAMILIADEIKTADGKVYVRKYTVDKQYDKLIEVGGANKIFSEDTKYFQLNLGRAIYNIKERNNRLDVRSNIATIEDGVAITFSGGVMREGKPAVYIDNKIINDIPAYVYKLKSGDTVTNLDSQFASAISSGTKAADFLSARGIVVPETEKGTIHLEEMPKNLQVVYIGAKVDKKEYSGKIFLDVGEGIRVPIKRDGKITTEGFSYNSKMSSAMIEYYNKRTDSMPYAREPSMYYIETGSGGGVSIVGGVDRLGRPTGGTVEVIPPMSTGGSGLSAALFAGAEFGDLVLWGSEIGAPPFAYLNKYTIGTNFQDLVCTENPKYADEFKGRFVAAQNDLYNKYGGCYREWASAGSGSAVSNACSDATAGANLEEFYRQYNFANCFNDSKKFELQNQGLWNMYLNMPLQKKCSQDIYLDLVMLSDQKGQYDKNSKWVFDPSYIEKLIVPDENCMNYEINFVWHKKVASWGGEQGPGFDESLQIAIDAGQNADLVVFSPPKPDGSGGTKISKKGSCNMLNDNSVNFFTNARGTYKAIIHPKTSRPFKVGISLQSLSPNYNNSALFDDSPIPQECKDLLDINSGFYSAELALENASFNGAAVAVPQASSMRIMSTSASSESGQEGVSATVTFTVKNFGRYAAKNAKWMVYVEGVKIADMGSVDLAPEEEKFITSKITLPNIDGKIKVMVDPNNAFPERNKEDNVEIIPFEMKIEEIANSSSDSNNAGNSNETKTETPTPPTPDCSGSWKCTGWSECTGGTQTRECVTASNCSITIKPAISRSCTVTNPNPNTEVSNSSTTVQPTSQQPETPQQNASTSTSNGSSINWTVTKTGWTVVKK